MIRKKLGKDEREPSLLEKGLRRVARFQVKHNRSVLVFFIILTILLGVGIANIEFQSDINEEMPQDLPIFQLNERIAETFGGQDSVLILVELDQDTAEDLDLEDIRDPEVIRFVTELHADLAEESVVDSITSAGQAFRHVPENQLTETAIKQTLQQNPQLQGLFSDDLTATMVVVTADVGSDEEKLDELEEVITRNVEAQAIPPGLELTITGNPSVLQTMMDFLKEDSVNTLLIAAGIIFILLLVIEKSITKTTLIFIPLTMGIIWTLGTLGWLGIKISVATAGLGAMLLGLGVEYGVFIHTRYTEERDKGRKQEESLTTAVPSVGSAMVGSGTTTIVGFLALTLSIMPMMQHLGQSLALGIAYCLVAAVLLAPTVFVTQENIAYALTHRKYHKYKQRKERHEVKAR
ncbi:MMPL family transporter [Candidatus Woesearchaeota archaeon]|nr:MMPL family transporter [Candidatus Woesearchaeota archaeon]